MLSYFGRTQSVIGLLKTGFASAALLCLSLTGRQLFVFLANIPFAAGPPLYQEVTSQGP
jgi:hypothetical protein